MFWMIYFYIWLFFAKNNWGQYSEIHIYAYKAMWLTGNSWSGDAAQNIQSDEMILGLIYISLYFQYMDVREKRNMQFLF